LTVLSNQVIADDCIIDIDTTTVDGEEICGGIGPGDTLLISAGDRGRLVFKDITGTEEEPVIIVNEGGIVKIDADELEAGIYLLGCEHVRLTGTGDPDIYYGFEIFNAKTGGGKGITVREFSKNIEIDHIEIHDIDGSGISYKTSKATETRPGWIQHGTHIHDTYIHDVTTEGMYIGKYIKGGTEAELDGVNIYNNRIERCGWEAIQVSNGFGDVYVHHNNVSDNGFGEKNSGNTEAGILGRKSNVKYYNNFIINSSRKGFSFNLMDAFTVYNNLIVGSGED